MPQVFTMNLDGSDRRQITFRTLRAGESNGVRTESNWLSSRLKAGTRNFSSSAPTAGSLES